MGGTQSGVVWNDSPFPIEYIVYGKFSQLANQKNTTQVNPAIQISTQCAQLKGFRLVNQGGKFNNYDYSYVRVQPGRFNITGLAGLKMNQHKISVRVILEEFEKFILTDVVIKDFSDMSLKVRYDLSLKNLTKKEVESLKQQLKEISTNPAMIKKEEQKNKERQQIRAQFLKQLRQETKGEEPKFTKKKSP